MDDVVVTRVLDIVVLGIAALLIAARLVWHWHWFTPQERLFISAAGNLCLAGAATALVALILDSPGNPAEPYYLASGLWVLYVMRRKPSRLRRAEQDGLPTEDHQVWVKRSSA